MGRWSSIPAFVLVAAGLASAASAQCPAWSTSFHSPGVAGTVRALTTFDDGGGAALYVGGDFTTAGTVKTKNVVKWDGSDWSALGTGLNSRVYDLTVFDDGGGPALFATGAFSIAGGHSALGIAKWDGATWSELGSGTNLAGHALAVFDDGSGPALYVGGFFATAGGVASPRVARWNGSAWSSVGGGVPLNVVNALTVYDDGSGAALFAGGEQSPSTNALMKWNGVSWTAVGAFAPPRTVTSLAVHDDGSGAALCVGGLFTGVDTLTTTNIARWDGTNWTALGTGVADGQVDSLKSFDDGSGAELFVGGTFTSVGGVAVSGLARWDGATWSDVGGGTSVSSTTQNVLELAEFDDGGGSKLWVGGDFGAAGTVAVDGLAAWDGASWSAADVSGQGLEGDYVAAFTTFDDGAGPALYAGGMFERAGTAIVDGIARWDGSAWSSVGGGVSIDSRVPGTVTALATYDDGSGSELFASGGFLVAGGVPVGRIARWDGSSWHALGSGLGLSSPANALVAHDDGSGLALFAGGYFVAADGASANHIAKWNGVNWHALGSGLNGVVYAMLVHDDGTGPALYVTGDFTLAGGATANRIARWDGSTWSTLGGGLSSYGRALAVHDDGGGPALYVGGQFTLAGGSPASGLAKWDGSNWHAVGDSTGADIVYALASHDDGFGPQLYAGGWFTVVGGANTKGIMRWDGASWSAVGGGLSSSYVCRALSVFDDGTAPRGALYVGGDFTQAGGVSSTLVASWTDTCACSGASYCTSGTTSSGCVPTISGSGRASASAASGFTISVSGVEGQRQGQFFYGLNGPNGASWGASSHFLCVKAPTQRTGTQDSGGTAGACDGSIALDWNAYCATHPNALGVPFSAGQSVWAQLYFRDPAGPKTTALSNGLMFTVCP